MNLKRSFFLLSTLLALLPAGAGAAEPAAPARLSQTGLYAKGVSGPLAPGVMLFSPQYPLWSDGADKKRWIRLPAGTAIDAGNPDAWVFPVGTRLWKAFRKGRTIETRMIDRLEDGRWRFVSYAWREDGSDADLAPARGLWVDAPEGRYRIPSQADCRACHEGAAAPVLGFSALQLSPDRDPLAPNREERPERALDLPSLVERGLLRGQPRSWLGHPPRVQAESAVERAALGYLHGNCAHCHNDMSEGGVPTGLVLAQRLGDPDRNQAVRASLDAESARYRPQGSAPASRRQWLLERMRSRDPRAQMPPLGTEQIDSQAIALIERWLAETSTPDMTTPVSQGGNP